MVGPNVEIVFKRDIGIWKLDKIKGKPGVFRCFWIPGFYFTHINAIPIALRVCVCACFYWKMRYCYCKYYCTALKMFEKALRIIIGIRSSGSISGVWEELVVIYFLQIHLHLIWKSFVVNFHISITPLLPLPRSREFSSKNLTCFLQHQFCCFAG